MRANLAPLHRNIELIVANSNDYDLTDREWLPGRIMNAFWGSNHINNRLNENRNW